MKSYQFERAARTTHAKWVRPLFLLVLIAAAASPAMAGFTAGPSVRLIPPNESIPFSRVEIRWIADFVGDGKVDVFDNANGTGTPIDTKVSGAPANDHTITFNVAGLVLADTTYFVKITHHDPNNSRPDLTNEPAPFPLFFTGAQAIPHVAVGTGTDTVALGWDANVIGLGRVTYGTSSPDELGPVDDQRNTPHHFFQL